MTETRPRWCLTARTRFHAYYDHGSGNENTISPVLGSANRNLSSVMVRQNDLLARSLCWYCRSTELVCDLGRSWTVILMVSWCCVLPSSHAPINSPTTLYSR